MQNKNNKKAEGNQICTLFSKNISKNGNPAFRTHSLGKASEMLKSTHYQKYKPNLQNPGSILNIRYYKIARQISLYYI